MPSESRAQLGFMRAELGRAQSGQRTRTGMSVSQLRDFAHPARQSLPGRVRQKGSYGGKPVAQST